MFLFSPAPFRVERIMITRAIVKTIMIPTICTKFEVESGHFLQSKELDRVYPGLQSEHNIPVYPSKHSPVSSYFGALIPLKISE